VGRLVARVVFGMDGVSQSIFAMGGIFSNNVLLGLPIAHVTLGEAALPAVSLVLAFNSLILWTLVTLSVEWARHRELSPLGLVKTMRGVITNPIVGSILAGTAWGFTGLALPGVLDRTLEMIGTAALPLSLVVLGMGLAEFGLRAGWRASVAITVLKLAAQPVAVYAIALALGLAPLDVAVVVLMAALPIGANVYLMARHFDVLEGPVASSIVLTTALGAATTPFALALAGAPVR
jgi:predicted permease